MQRKKLTIFENFVNINTVKLTIINRNNKRSGGNMKKILSLIMSVTLVMSLAGCAEKASGTQTPAPAAGEIIIGGLQDLSGGSSVSGVAMDRGAQMAVREINDKGGINGKKIKYIPYDTKGTPQEGLNAYTRLVDQDKAVAVVGPPISNIGLALTETAAQKKVPIVGAFIDSRVTKKEDGKPQDYMFLVQPTNQQSGTIQAGYLVDELGLKKVALFYDKTNAFGVSQVEAFKAYVEANGGEIVQEQVFKSGDVDFKTQLNKIKESGAEAIFAPNYPKDNTLYCTQLNQLGMSDIVTMGGLEFAPPFLTTLPDPTLVDNVYFALNVAFDDPKLADLNQSYLDTYTEAKSVDDISVKVYLGYDAIRLIAEAIKNTTGDITGEAVKAGLEGIEGFEALPGKIGFSPESHQPIGLSMVMYKINKGVNEKIGPYVPEVLK